VKGNINVTDNSQLHRFQHHELTVRRHGSAIAENLLQLVEIVQVAVGHDVQLAVDLQAAARVVEHLPGNVIRQGVLLVERRVTEHGVEAEWLHAGERVVDHELAAIQRLWHVRFYVQAAGCHRHRRFIAKDHAGLRVLRQQCQTDHPVTAAEIDDLPFQVFRQMFNEETRSDVQPGAREDVRVVVDSPVGAFQLPAQGFRRVSQLWRTKRTVDQARFFPRQSGGGWPQYFLEQRNRRGVDIARFGTGNNARLRRHYLTQRTQLLLQQRHGFWDLNQHDARRLRVFRGAVEELNAGFSDIVMA